MVTKLLRQAPVVTTIVGVDTHRGWLPAGAANPLPTVPETALLDVRLVARDAEVVLVWQAHDIGLWPQPSGRGERVFQTVSDASAAASDLFAVAEADWTIAPEGLAVTSDQVAAIVKEVLIAYEVEYPEEHGWGRLVDPPRLVSFRVTSGQPAELWLILEPTSAGGYAVFYDSESGTCGLATTADDGELTYIADYGPLWTTLIGM